ncbi:hypothetical protein VCUG_02239 [Vavraia culicis subsp. floridensis]|uniref:Uncharacterized protein n=1 Tax=Vavraia culicis (isolate floridensis) TaxID=948595 RepID=L2GSC3_VAVCU|nr:uncharacterized protein VCUG_02239 [Vavraia culicis subsp. floridensis]ELA46272.1 hypothetical protein VCUG_02239 [Vavraia culicis subsp. floridensis]
MKNLLYLILLIVGVVAVVVISIFVFGYFQAKKYEKKFMEEVDKNYQAIQGDDAKKELMNKVKILMFYKDDANGGHMTVKGVEETDAFKNLKDSDMKKPSEFLDSVKNAENELNVDNKDIGLAFDVDKVPDKSKDAPFMAGVGSMFTTLNAYKYEKLVKDLKAKIKKVDDKNCPVAMLSIDTKSVESSLYFVEDSTKGKFKDNKKAEHKTHKFVEHKGKVPTQAVLHFLLKEVLGANNSGSGS